VGPYTAAAIASFCFEESVPVIDGNVIRVISRYFGLKEAVNENKTAKEIRSIAHDTLGKNNPALYNQAIMNFGAIQCKPRNPDCNSCPLKNSCIARNENAVSEIPYKSKKTIKRKRFFEYFIIHTKGKIYFGKREGKDIWKHLWQFPLIEVKSFQSKNSLEKLIKKNFGLGQYVFIPGLEEIKQQLTHQTIASKIHLILLDDQNYPKLDAYKKVEMSKISDFPTPKTINNFLSNNNLSLVIKKYAKYK